MSGVFVVGSINRDFVLGVERRPSSGETVTNAELSLHNGGKGANQAVAAARLGAPVTMLGRVGEDELGEPLVRALEDNGVDTHLVTKLRDTKTGTALITVTPDGENAIAVAPGANLRLAEVDVDRAAGAIEAADVLVTQLEISLVVVRRAVEAATAMGTRVVVNLAPPFELPTSVMERLDPVVVNEHEAAFLLGKEVRTSDEALAAAKELVKSGVRSSVVTLGSGGAVCAGGDFVRHFPAPDVEVVDTTGAGDAFVGALAAKLAEDASLERATCYAVKAGAAAVSARGAQDSLPVAKTIKALGEVDARRTP